MKYITRNINILWRSVAVSLIAMITLMFTGCELQRSFKYESSNPTAELNMTAWEFISSHDTLEMFEQVIAGLGMENYYQEDAIRTFIAPTNNAFKEYLSDNGYSSIEEVPEPLLRNVVKYHLVNARVTFNDPDLTPSNNPIAYSAENGQIMYLSHNSNYQGLVNEDTNISWTIVTSNLEPTNGIMHVIASVVYFSEDGGSTSYDTLATGIDNLELASNTGLSIESGGSYALNADILEVTGASAENIIYELDEVPVNGWLINGAAILQQGDRFTQMDVDVLNLVYVHDGNSTSDQLDLSVHDRTGETKVDFNIDISVL